VNYRQIVRQMMAEDGSEKTPDEVDEIIDKFCPPFRLYEKLSAMSDEDIRTLAEECGDTYEYTKEMVDIACFIGFLKWAS